MSTSGTTTMSLDRYAAESKALVAGAQALADEQGHVEVEPLHLLHRVLERAPGAPEVFRRAGTNVVELQAMTERALARLPKSTEPAYLSTTFLDLLERAGRERDRDRVKEVGVDHLLNALSQEIRGSTGEIFGALDIGPGALRQHLGALRHSPRESSTSDGSVLSEYTKDLVEEARQGDSDPVIGRDVETRRLLTILERRHKNHPLLIGEPGVGKGAIVRALAQRIAGGDVPTSLAGVRLFELDSGSLVAGAKLRGEIEGRVRRLIEALAQAGGSESILFARGIDQLFGHGPAGSQVGELLKPALARGEVRMLATTTPEGSRRIDDRDSAALRLFTALPVDEPSVDEATDVLRGLAHRFEGHHGVHISEGAIVAAVVLAKRYLQDRFLPDSAIDLLDEAAASRRVETDGLPPELDAVVRRLQSLESQLLSLATPDDERSVSRRKELEAEAESLRPLVDDLKNQLESRRGAVAAVRAIGAELETARAELVSARGASDRGRAGELEDVEIPELESRLAQAEEAARNAGASDGQSVLADANVATTLAAWTGIPVAKMLEAEAEKLLKMEERLGRRVVGQSDAVRAISRSVRRGRVGLRDPKRPIGSFLFLGPSGVGKTELAKAVAEFLFDDEAALTRLDMSEFMERHMAQRLLGAPPGYADSEQGGFLTEAVRRRPYSVLLFDEVEKAHHDVFNLLLQVLDDGRLTDGRGRLADFTNTVVIMTCNIGSSRILEADPKLFEREEGMEALRDVLLEQLSEFFRPEFLNRVDDVVVFRPLDRGNLRAIVDIQLAELERMLGERRVRLELDDAAKDRLVNLGYEPALGARPLKRAILKHVQDPLAGGLLSGDFRNGALIRVSVSGDDFVFDASGP